MTVLALDADIAAGTDLLGKSVSDLQENVTVSDHEITGTLKYVTGYTGFSGDTELQSGNYLALHAECEEADSVTIRWDDATEEKTLDADGLMVLRVTDLTRKLVITAKKSGEEDRVETYSLAGLTVNEE